MLISPFIDELKHEAVSARKMLERIPADKMDWQPHEKSMTLRQLASHVAEIPSYISVMMTKDALDFAAGDLTPVSANNAEELVREFDARVHDALRHMRDADDATMQAQWTARAGSHTIFTIPRVVALRTFVFSHFIHHRGQLSVYLRLLDIPVPSIYGPSADETAA